MQKGRLGLGGGRKPTHHEPFLVELGEMVPRVRFAGLIAPHYPVAGRERRSCPLAPGHDGRCDADRGPALTKTRDRKRDLRIKPTWKGNQRHFGMKARIGVDAATGCVHSADMTLANVHDPQVADALAPRR